MKKDLIIDADHILYYVAMANSHKPPDFPDDDEGEVFETSVETTYKLPLKPYKKHFKDIIEEYKRVWEIESVGADWKCGKVKVIFSDPKGNFRYDIFPDYKKDRDESQKSAEFYRLRKWAHKKYTVGHWVEADDVVAYYVRKGHIGVSTDKDLLRGVEGQWYDANFAAKTWVINTKEEAERFTLLQTLSGDSGDGIDGIAGIGNKPPYPKAVKLLDEYGWNWEGVVASFENAVTGSKAKGYVSQGLTAEDALLTRRLIGMDQWKPKRGIKLWKPKKY